MQRAGGVGAVDDLFVAALHSVVLPGGLRLRMDALRGLAGEIGLGSARTVGATGNLLFVSRGRSVAALERLLEQSFEQRFGKFVPVFVRPAGAFLDLPSRDPFGGVHDPTCVSVRLMRHPCPDDLAAALRRHATDERLAVVAGDLWIGFPSGPAGSRLPAALARREVGAGGTFRSLSMIHRICEAVRQVAPLQHRAQEPVNP